jgi:hypothetical protein
VSFLRLLLLHLIFVPSPFPSLPGGSFLLKT